ncbi:hypothetical protein ACFFX1_12845 [Dactylosporangium sucinum]|uniref:Uncharacterized protein n=1 Tax=Dactylosporangium sucinum TaxID=1424081 RepID=A0A917WYW6_9ACTN|nr:hypothetical protein [Dactylosporangium sucinum]GGM41258.1 hypothetical protein GCM10007977_048350 [Dactylosporangium sucinum]
MAGREPRINSAPCGVNWSGVQMARRRGREVMPNDRLRTAMPERGITPTGLADVLEVDSESVERWIGGRLRRSR